MASRVDSPSSNIPSDQEGGSLCFKYTAIAIINLVVVGGIILGLVAHYGAGLNAIGTTGGLAMSIISGGLLAAEMIALYFKQRKSTLSSQEVPLVLPSIEDAEVYKHRLNIGEFFVYLGTKYNGYPKMIWIYHRDKDIGLAVFYYFNYNSFKKEYTEISLKELQKRAQ